MANTINTKLKLPDCSAEIQRDATFTWTGGAIWLAHTDRFICEKGNRKVIFEPHLVKTQDETYGCEGCQFFTGCRERNG